MGNFCTTFRGRNCIDGSDSVDGAAEELGAARRRCDALGDDDGYAALAAVRERRRQLAELADGFARRADQAVKGRVLDLCDAWEAEWARSDAHSGTLSAAALATALRRRQGDAHAKVRGDAVCALIGGVAALDRRDVLASLRRTWARATRNALYGPRVEAYVAARRAVNAAGDGDGGARGGGAARRDPAAVFVERLFDDILPVALRERAFCAELFRAGDDAGLEQQFAALRAACAAAVAGDGEGPTSLRRVEALGVLALCERVQGAALRAADPELAAHLNARGGKTDVLPQVYMLPWLRLLFGRQFPVGSVLVLWDAFFSTARGAQTSVMVVSRVTGNISRGDGAAKRTFFCCSGGCTDVRRGTIDRRIVGITSGLMTASDVGDT